MTPCEDCDEKPEHEAAYHSISKCPICLEQWSEFICQERRDEIVRCIREGSLVQCDECGGVSQIISWKLRLYPLKDPEESVTQTILEMQAQAELKRLGSLSQLDRRVEVARTPAAEVASHLHWKEGEDCVSHLASSKTSHQKHHQ